MNRFREYLKNLSPEHPDIEIDVELTAKGESMRGKMIARTAWSDDKNPKYIGIFGKIVHLEKIN
ncbi:MAG: hypothetical protein K2H93_03575, partial [Oscillospiraceae bacterium]|nr:hypothetical protein [Oscillospiraceae bacterium]